MMKHYDKRPANALIAKAVEICAQKGISHLVYYSYIYNDPKSSLTEFKRRNGFEKVLLPRYYIPLTAKGKIALNLGLHRGLVKTIPNPLLSHLLRFRSLWNAHRVKAVEGDSVGREECRVSSGLSQGFQESRLCGSFSGWSGPFAMSLSIYGDLGRCLARSLCRMGRASGLLFRWNALRSERGDVVLVFSGEEFPEPGTAQRLNERGHKLDGAGPDYLVHLYEEDPSFPAGLNGRFHGLLIDRNRGLHAFQRSLWDAPDLLPSSPRTRSISLRKPKPFLPCVLN